MNSNRNVLAGALLGAAALWGATGISIAAAADETAATPAAPSPYAQWHHRHGAGRLLSKLNLSAEQQTSVKAIVAAARPQLKSIREEMRANSLKLRQTQPNDPNYTNVLAQVAQANGSLHSQLITQREAMRAQIFKVLTPSQQTQLAALQAQMQARIQARRQARAAGAAAQ